MMRSSAWLALLACSVARHRWPVSANCDRVLHRLAVADLADQDHVGRLAQRVLQRGVPGVGVDADLALRDDAVLVLVHVLDRVLDRDDVAVASSRCGSRSSPPAWSTCPSRCAPTRMHQAALGHARRPSAPAAGSSSSKVGILALISAHAPCRRALLHEGVDAEAADARRRDREVALLGGVELRRLLVVHDRAHQRRVTARR